MLVSKHEPNVRTLLLDMRMMVSPMQLTDPSLVRIQIVCSANPNQLKTERSENNLRFLRIQLADHLKCLFLDGDDEGVFIVPSIDARSQILSIKDQRNGIVKFVSRGFGPLLHLIWVFRVFALEVLRRVLSFKLKGFMCVSHLLARFSAAWRVEVHLSVVSSCFDVYFTLWLC